MLNIYPGCGFPHRDREVVKEKRGDVRSAHPTTVNRGRKSSPAHPTTFRRSRRSLGAAAHVPICALIVCRPVKRMLGTSPRQARSPCRGVARGAKTDAEADVRPVHRFAVYS